MMKADIIEKVQTDQCGSEFIPVKGKPKVPNSCPRCGQTCPECRYDLCPSNYKSVSDNRRQHRPTCIAALATNRWR
jgi:hypothetical protein